MILFRQWLLEITAAAMLVALAEALIPAGTMRRVGKLTGGLLLMIVVLRPVIGMDYSALSENFSRWRQDLGSYQAQPEVTNFQVMKTIIESKSAAYIQDKAEGLGILCQAEVKCSAENTRSYPYPASVTIKGNLSSGQIRQLQELIEAELAIPTEKQRYSEKGGELP